MHDIKAIRENPAAFDNALGRRGLPAQSTALLALDAVKREEMTELQNLQAKRNEIAKQIGEAMRTDKARAEALKAEAATIKETIAALEAAQNEAGELEQALSRIPNLLAEDVPAGADESGNIEERMVGTKPSLGFAAKDHVALGEGLGLMDFEGAAKLSGARFVVLKGALAKMERALAAFMLDIHTNEFGYTEHQVPFMVKDAALYGTGQLPKFEADLYLASAGSSLEIVKESRKLVQDATGIKDPTSAEKFAEMLDKHYHEKLWLIPTSEVSLTNLVANEILDETKLPQRMTAFTPCFRSEAGSAGRDTRGMIRQHQFSKVEMVSITTPEQSEAEHTRMLSAAEEVLKRLGLHYRVMLLCAGDTGFSARKTFDIEVWLPAQDTFREISSCSNCGDFQARRMKARFRKAGAKETQFVHTLNGSGLAVGRTLVAILENYQQADGSIAVPEALQPYMGGLKVIVAA